MEQLFLWQVSRREILSLLMHADNNIKKSFDPAIWCLILCLYFFIILTAKIWFDFTYSNTLTWYRVLEFRTAANAVTSTISTGATIFAPNAMQALITSYGVRNALLITGVFGLGAVPFSLGLRTPRWYSPQCETSGRVNRNLSTEGKFLSDHKLPFTPEQKCPYLYKKNCFVQKSEKKVPDSEKCFLKDLRTMKLYFVTEWLCIQLLIILVVFSWSWWYNGRRKRTICLRRDLFPSF